jgi:Fe-S-cluster-containing hydrogenase component 2
VRIDADKCISCQQCVISCPFGAIFVHDDVATPFKCDLCGGRPQCVQHCPKQALQYVPEHELGEANRVATVLRYAHMREVEYVEEGERKKLRYAEIGREQGTETAD